jgi:thiamine-phosphate pyrophosphorylase
MDYALYFVTDRDNMTTPSVEESIELALAGGATVVQLREKNLSSHDFFETAMRAREITRRAGVPLIINDRADIAMAAGAEGVHIGTSDLPCRATRRIVGNSMIIGVSARSAEEAIAAALSGADYLGVGAMFATETKKDAKPVGMSELARIREAVQLPIVVIGGINQDNAASFAGTGINGIAASRAIAGARDVAAAARELKKMCAF